VSKTRAFDVSTYVTWHCNTINDPECTRLPTIYVRAYPSVIHGDGRRIETKSDPGNSLNETSNWFLPNRFTKKKREILRSENVKRSTNVVGTTERKCTFYGNRYTLIGRGRVRLGYRLPVVMMSAYIVGRTSAITYRYVHTPRTKRSRYRELGHFQR